MARYTILHRYKDGTVLECGNEKTEQREVEIIRQNTAKKIFEELERANVVRLTEDYWKIKNKYTGGKQ